LAEQIWRDGRTAAVAALTYGLNSSFLYFDTQFGYESLAIALMVWTLIAMHRAIRGPGRSGWSAVTVLLAGATVVTHHLTALGMLAIMVVFAAALTCRRGCRLAARTAWLLTLAAAALIVAWLWWVAPRTAGYLDPYLGTALTQMAGMVG